LAANLVEMAEKSGSQITMDEKTLPYKKEVVAVTELLGLDKFSLASEGRFIASVSPRNVDKVLRELQKFNKEAKVIGRAKKAKTKKEVGVFVETDLGGKRKIEMPRGKLIPRIC
jgi:hydrogenase expression/formation protein HypE